MTLTREQIAGLRELLAKATPGPWKSWDRGIGWEVHNSDDRSINDEFRETFTRADAETIAAAVNALPALLDIAEAVDAARALALSWRHNAQGCSRGESHAAGTWRSCARELEAVLPLAGEA